MMPRQLELPIGPDPTTWACTRCSTPITRRLMPDQKRAYCPTCKTMRPLPLALQLRLAGARDLFTPTDMTGEDHGDR